MLKQCFQSNFSAEWVRQEGSRVVGEWSVKAVGCLGGVWGPIHTH